jgi:hypothetical protein
MSQDHLINSNIEVSNSAKVRIVHLMGEEIESPKTRGSVIGLLKAAKRLYIGGVPS